MRDGPFAANRPGNGPTAKETTAGRPPAETGADFAALIGTADTGGGTDDIGAPRRRRRQPRTPPHTTRNRAGFPPDRRPPPRDPPRRIAPGPLFADRLHATDIDVIAGRLSDRDHAILRSIDQHHFLTVRQMEVLHFANR